MRNTDIQGPHSGKASQEVKELRREITNSVFRVCLWKARKQAAVRGAKSPNVSETARNQESEPLPNMGFLKDLERGVVTQ